MPSGTVTISLTITSRTWVKRSTPVRSDSVTIPTGRSPSTTTAAPWARLCSRTIASPAVVDGANETGVS